MEASNTIYKVKIKQLLS